MNIAKFTDIITDMNTKITDIIIGMIQTDEEKARWDRAAKARLEILSKEGEEGDKVTSAEEDAKISNGPRSPYYFYASEMLDANETSKIAHDAVSKKWKAMNEINKAPYEDMAHLELKCYLKEMEDYWKKQEAI